VRPALRPLRVTLALLAGAAYLALGHWTASSEHPPVIGVVAGFATLGAIVLAAVWRSRYRIVLLALYALAVAVLLARFETLRAHAAWLYFVQHVGAMGALGLAFGSTLGAGDANAMCSRIAGFVSTRPLDETYLRYTWRVTLAWTVFFGAMALSSVLLFFLGPVEVWSFLANIATPVLLGAMFAGEYLIRRAVLPDGGEIGIAATIQAFRDYSRRDRRG
jgi:uncharacterized membrane protein